ncbi:MAG: hypothetical protein LRY73_05900 [Bacillus sp. (in: Bacteria)]|nr:hypothetical protein [Bacillus sp. (in: firmicutes)]
MMAIEKALFVDFVTFLNMLGGVEGGDSSDERFFKNKLRVVSTDLATKRF